MTQITRVFALTLVILFACTAGLAACAPANVAVPVNTPEPTPTAAPTATPTAKPTAIPTPSSVPTQSPSPVPPESLTFKQKSDMIGSRVGLNVVTNPSRIYIFYLESKDQKRLVWVKKESNPPGNGFDLLDVFNDEILFHVSIEPKDQAKVTPSEFPKYVDRMNESLSHYSIVAAGKLLDINDLYTSIKIDSSGTGNPYDALSQYLKKAQAGFVDWSRDEILVAFIDVTPAQYILPIWEYVPNAVTPSSYFNPPSPTPVLTPTPTVSPIPDSYKNQVLPLLGIVEDFEPIALGALEIFELSFGNITGRIWGYKNTRADDSSKYDIHSLCNDEYLFTIDIPNRTAVSDDYMYLVDSSKNLKNLKLINSTALVDMARNYEYIGISYNDCQEIKDIFSRYEEDPEGTMYTYLSKEQVIDLIIRSTPQDKIIPFWVYTPGAKIPEELKGIFSEKDFPPAPAE